MTSTITHTLTLDSDKAEDLIDLILRPAFGKPATVSSTTTTDVYLTGPMLEELRDLPDDADFYVDDHNVMWIGGEEAGRVSW